MTSTPLSGHPVLAPDILAGFSLLEADAGTGKTWTLANLVVRALVERGANIEDIAVVTFTNKAAAELRDRILQAIERLDAALSGESVDDPFIAAWLPRCEASRDLPRLRQARAMFDQAPVLTIHGLCQRILAEQSLSVPLPIGAERLADDGALVEAAVQRWWRERLLVEDEWTIGVLRASGNTATQLARDLRAIGLAGSRMLAPPPLELRWYADELRRRIDALRAALAAEGAALHDWALTAPGLNRKSYNRRTVPGWLGALARWLDGMPAVLVPGDSARTACERLGAQALGPGPGTSQPPGTLPARIDALRDLVARQAGLRSGLLAELRDTVLPEVALRKRRLGLLSHDDVLVRVRDALREPGAGEALAARLRRRYPFILVDECQDTDPCQWEIFERLHAPNFDGSGDPGLALVLVGDPKQAIYSFRNADIFAYLDARRQAHRRLRLDQNQRASDALVTGINALLARPGAFLLDEIVFEPARPGSRPRDGWCDPEVDDDRRALCLVEAKGTGKDGRRAAALEAMAAEVARLLGGKGGGIRARDGTTATLRAKDIAVLVRRTAEGVLAKAALRRRGIGAVEISRASVFSSDEAAGLLRIIAAVADPADRPALRSALLSTPLGLDATRLTQRERDPLAWATTVEHFMRAQRTWSRLGPVAALRRLLFHDFDAAGGLAADREGERRLTNLRHLLELLGAMPEARDGPARARELVEERMAGERSGDETAELRLESDADLVQILTIHKSKGLEFPVVFVPLAWYDAPGGKGAEAVVAHETDPSGGSRAVLVCGPPDAREGDAVIGLRKRARLERDAEEVRLTYVAATRASQRLYLFWSDEDKDHGPLEAILGPERRGWIAGMHEAHPEVVALLDGERLLADGGGDVVPAPAGPELDARPFDVDIPEPWLERSYTALMRAMVANPGQSPDLAEPADALRPDHDEWVVPVEIDEEDPAAMARAGMRHGFPAGPRAGTALHAVLEQADPRHPVAIDLVERVLARHGIVADARPVAEWLDTVFGTPLCDGSGTAFTLRESGPGQVVRELEFTLPAAVGRMAGRTRRIIEIVREAYPVDGTIDGGSGWHGYLRGFIDLVVEADGRYWVLDWKSNRLGADDQAYTPAAMGAAIARHGYAVQFCLYTLAVHRLLRARMPDYDYERHFGGVFYAFLRGMRGTAGSGVWFARPPATLVAGLDALLAGWPEPA